MPRNSRDSPHGISPHRREKSKRHSKHELASVKPEPPDDSLSNTVHAPKSKTDSRKRHIPYDSNSPKHEGRGRLSEPKIIKREEGHRKRRLRSPVLLKPEADRSPRRHSDKTTVKGDLSQSGLLNKEASAAVPKQRANFGLSGKLAEDTNTYKGVVIKYNEPPDARKPTEHWRLYVFKGNETLPILHIHRQSGFLIGRDRKIADIPMDHPSISKQHAVLQYRQVRGLVRLYLIDLESANGTYLNNKRIEPRRYYELIEKDLIKFGYSSREYVVMPAALDEDEEEEQSSTATGEKFE